MELILKKLGNPGLFHLIIGPLFAITWWSVALGNTGNVFWGSKSKFQCNSSDPIHIDPLIDMNDNPEVSSTRLRRDLNGTSPVFSYTDDSEWNVTNGECNFTISQGNLSKTEECKSWVYEDDGKQTIIKEWNLVCKEAYRLSMASSVYYAGVFFGGLIFGFVADRLGRKKTLAMCLYVQLPISLSVAFMPTFTSFMIMRFILGIWLQGISTVAFVHCVEFFRQKYRGAIMAAFGLGWASGQMLTALLAFVLPYWKHMQIASSLVCLVTIPYLWWLPESPRWLMSRNRKDEILDVFITRAARMNGKNVDELVSFSRQRLEILAREQELSVNPKETPSFVNLLKSGILIKRLCICCSLWLSSTMTYYTFLINIRNLAGSPHANFAVGAALEIIMNVIIILIMNRFGRKVPLIISQFLVGGLCLIAGFIPKETASGVDISPFVTAMSLFGKMVCTAGMCVEFVYTAELFPTFARGGCFALCGSAMRIGSTIAPQLIFLGDHLNFPQFSNVVMAITTIGSGILAIFLPRTLGMQMPTTVEDSINLEPIMKVNKNENVLLPKEKLNQEESSSTLTSMIT